MKCQENNIRLHKVLTFSKKMKMFHLWERTMLLESESRTLTMVSASMKALISPKTKDHSSCNF